MNYLEKYILLTVFLILGSSLCTTLVIAGEDLDWPKLQMENKPGVYWWWMGSAVDKQNLTYNLEKLHQAGIGGVTVVPIYSVEGDEARYLNYLSPEWVEMLAYATGEARRLGMWVDMTTGTGWPFGGSHITPLQAAKKVEFKKFEIPAEGELPVKMEPNGLQALMAFSREKRPVNLINNLAENGALHWTVPAGHWTLFAVWQRGTGQKVKRAAPGNEGLVLDPFSVGSQNYYLQRFDKAFANYTGIFPRAQYHDSFEYYHATWTDNLFDEFEKCRGYDLRQYLPLLFADTESDSVARLKTDYRQTLAELHLDYIRNWVNWTHKKGGITREQAHGAPANLLDLYAAADIPETEIFGSTPFKIPGLRRLPENVAKDSPNPLMLQFASSAAHVAGKSLVASETCTWLREHFKTAFSQAKPEIDQLFLSGINHIFYHGSAYSPQEAAWPGWLFYASTHFQPTNPLWRDFPNMNEYVTRCQSILQSGKPANDLLLYWPVYDVWHKFGHLVKLLAVHNLDWLLDSDFGEVAAGLKAEGFSFDYISDNQIQQVKNEGTEVKTGGLRYKAILLPECGHLPLRTWKKLLNLAQNGATILIHRKLPVDVPGLANLETRRKKLASSLGNLNFRKEERSGVKTASVGKGRVVVTENLSLTLTEAGVKPESLVKTGIGFIRRKTANGYYYFLSNFTSEVWNGWIPLSVPLQSAVIFDPLDGRAGVAAVSKIKGSSQIYLQLSPGQSCFVRTSTAREVNGTAWRYLFDSGEPIEISGNWQVEFTEGGSVLPKSVETGKLKSWTKLGNADAKRFSGTARYHIRFDLPAIQADDWLLDLGRVCESARVKINGRPAGTLWSVPYQMPVGKFLQKGENRLEIEVTNLAINRIIDLDRRGVNWKKFFFVNINYKPFDASDWQPVDSGLLGPVVLKPQKLRKNL